MKKSKTSIALPEIEGNKRQEKAILILKSLKGFSIRDSKSILKSVYKNLDNIIVQ